MQDIREQVRDQKNTMIWQLISTRRSCGYYKTVGSSARSPLVSTDAFMTSDWMTHQHRDTCASIAGHPPLLSFAAIADGESIGRVKFELAEVGLNVVSNTSYQTEAHSANATTLWTSATER
jgi:hypothetical protein